MTENIQYTRKRNPLAAAFLSFLMPGVGQVYCGSFDRGIVLLFANIVLASVGTLVLLPIPASLRILGFAAAVLDIFLWLFAVIDGHRLARRISANYVLKDYNCWYVYVILIAIYLPLGLAWGHYVRSGIVAPFRVAGTKMAPAIELGDRVLVNRLAYHEAPVRRGDIVALINPNKRNETFLTRVVALPQDRISILNGEVFLNGKKLDRTPAPAPADAGADAFQENDGSATYRITVRPDQKDADLPELQVPNGHCFVLSDNRTVLYDSRNYGPVPLTDILGRVELIYYPRWQRVNTP